LRIGEDVPTESKSLGNERDRRSISSAGSKTLAELGQAVIEDRRRCPYRIEKTREIRPSVNALGRVEDPRRAEQEFIADAEVEAVSDDLAGSFIDEDRQPVHDGEGDIINGDVFDDTVTFHG
jgi:hypothetical protein